MYRLEFRSYLNEELYYEEVFYFESLTAAHAHAGQLLQSMNIDSLGDRYDIRLGLSDSIPLAA